MDTLARLERWYWLHCDGDWEHDSGFSLHAVDNPGWMIKQKLSHLGLSLRRYVVEG